MSAVAHPTEFGQLDASVLLVYLEALGDAKTFPLPFLLELGEVGCFPKEVAVGTFEIL